MKPSWLTRGSRGFTLVELLVVVSIFTIITSLILVRQSKFNSTILLTNLAYDVALSVREAQVYGLSVREFSSGTSQTFTSGYGVYFSRTLLDSEDPSYLLFADISGGGLPDQLYDAGSDGIEERFRITGGYVVSDLCVTAGSGSAETCGLSTLHIAFIRPDPDAIISIDADTMGYQSARIVVASTQGDTRSVIVRSTGQISVQGE